MTKVRFFIHEYMSELQKEVNDFIEDREIVNISLSVDGHYRTVYYCCVVYKDKRR